MSQVFDPQRLVLLLHKDTPEAGAKVRPPQACIYLGTPILHTHTRNKQRDVLLACHSFKVSHFLHAEKHILIIQL